MVSRIMRKDNYLIGMLNKVRAGQKVLVGSSKLICQCQS